MAALEADPQVKPLAARLQAVLAPVDTLRELADLHGLEVRALRGHAVTLAAEAGAAMRHWRRARRPRRRPRRAARPERRVPTPERRAARPAARDRHRTGRRARRCPLPG